jgi:hypothetical protein
VQLCLFSSERLPKLYIILKYVFDSNHSRIIQAEKLTAVTDQINNCSCYIVLVSFATPKIVTITSFLIFEKLGRFCFFVTSWLLKFFVCNNRYWRCNSNGNDVTIKRIGAHHLYVQYCTTQERALCLRNEEAEKKKWIFRIFFNVLKFCCRF